MLYNKFICNVTFIISTPCIRDVVRNVWALVSFRGVYFPFTCLISVTLFMDLSHCTPLSFLKLFWSLYHQNRKLCRPVFSETWLSKVKNKKCNLGYEKSIQSYLRSNYHVKVYCKCSCSTIFKIINILNIKPLTILALQASNACVL